MLEGKKISELDTVTNLQTGCCFPILSKGATKRITFGSLLSEIKGNLPETGIEEVKEDVQTLKTRADEASENINTLTADVENIKTEVADVDEMVAGQNATIRNCVSTVEGLEQRIEQTHFDDVLELEEQVRANAANVEKKLDKTTSASNAGKAVVVDENGNLVFGAAGVQVSHIEGNAIEEKQDGIYVETVNVSKEEGNALEKKTDGLFVSQVGGSSPIGTIIAYAGENVPAGFLLCDGRELLISDYQKLYEVIGQLPACQSENEGYFKLFDLRGKFTQGANNNLGENIAAGLPNITGSFYTTFGNDTSYTKGALVPTQRVGGFAGGPTDLGDVLFDASKGETKTDGTLKTADEHNVYGASDTVQPPAITVNFIIKATSTDDAIDNIIDDNTKDVGHAWSGAKVAEEIEKITNYSTEEKVVGTWIDGKPIYRKVVSGFTYGTSEINVSTGITNIDLLLELKFMENGVSGAYTGYAYNGNRTDTSLRINLTTGVVSSDGRNTSVQGTKGILILEYTKTTD